MLEKALEITPNPLASPAFGSLKEGSLKPNNFEYKLFAKMCFLFVECSQNVQKKQNYLILNVKKNYNFYVTKRGQYRKSK